MPQGVYLFLGYSEKDESLLKEVTGEGAEDALGAIQGLVSYHNVNANKVSANQGQARGYGHITRQYLIFGHTTGGQHFQLKNL